MTLLTGVTSFVLLGEAPNAVTVRRPDLWLVPDDTGIRHTANRLRDLAGWTTEQYLAVFGRRDNVVRRPVPRWSKRTRLEAQTTAYEWLSRCLNSSMAGVLCLGSRARTAVFGSDKTVEPCVWHQAEFRELEKSEIARVAWIPHTSGLCRWWNDAVNRETGRAFLATMLQEVFP